MTSPRTRIVEEILTGNRFLLTAHINPDGDAVGSLVALMHLLKALDKNPELVMPDRKSVV